MKKPDMKKPVLKKILMTYTALSFKPWIKKTKLKDMPKSMACLSFLIIPARILTARL